MRCLLHQTKRLCARYLGCLQPRFTFLSSFSSSSFDKSRYKSTYRLLSTKPPDTTISKTKLPFTIDEKDIEESFTRGSGPGGQSVNKTQNKVI